MSTEKKQMSPFLVTFLGVGAAVLVAGLIDRFVLSKVANHLENLISGND